MQNPNMELSPSELHTPLRKRPSSKKRNLLASSVETFLCHSTQIQQEIQSLGKMCRQLKEKKQLGLWGQVNEQLTALGLAAVELDGGVPNLDSLGERVLELLKRVQLAPELYAKLEVDSFGAAVAAIDTMQKVVKSVPSLNSFIDTLCVEVLGESVVRTSKTADALVDSISNMKKQLKTHRKFRGQVSKIFQEEKEKKILWKCRALAHFKKLFQVRKNEEVSAMEQVFWFTHEVKDFLVRIRAKFSLSDKMPVSRVFHYLLNSSLIP